MRSNLVETRKRLTSLHLAILVAFGILALAAVYWSLVRGPNILGRSDNPRLVEEELRIRRGSIFDVNSLELAVSREIDGLNSREYPLPSAAPAVGYYSIRHGTSGVEETFDAYLRGVPDDFWSSFWQHELLGEPQVGRDLRLTIDSRWQERASGMLDDRKGAVLLFSLPDVAIRAMASSPGYDPTNLESDFEQLIADESAPLLNRVTQGQYQPGLLLQPFLLAVAQQEGVVDLEDTPDRSDRAVLVNGYRVQCQATELGDEMTWAESLAARCPGPMFDLGQQLGSDWLLSALELFGLAEQPNLAIAANDESEATYIENAGLAAIGQDALAVNPLQLGLALAALANDGQYGPAQLVAAEQDQLGKWIATAQTSSSVQVVPKEVARKILNAFSQNDGIREQEVIVLSGPEGELNSWYLGLAPAADPRYGVVVVAEDDDGAQSATEIGRDLLKMVLDPNQQ